MTSADFSQFVVTARLLSLKPRLRDLPSYGRTLSGLYPLGLLSAVRIVIGLLLPLQHYPCLPAFYQVLVHRANRLPPTSFRFRLTADTLAFGCNLPTIRAVWGLAPVRVRSCWANQLKGGRMATLLCICISMITRQPQKQGWYHQDRKHPKLNGRFHRLERSILYFRQSSSPYKPF